METRALIHRLRRDLQERGYEKRVSLFRIIKTDEKNNTLDELYEYNDDECFFNFQLQYMIYRREIGLGEMLFNVKTLIRPAMMSSLQVEQDPEYWMNENVMQRAFESSCRFNDIPEEYKENDREYYQFPEEYADYLKYFCRDAGIKLSMSDCCEQDIYLYGLSEPALVKMEETKEGAIVRDWTLPEQYKMIEFEMNDSFEYLEEMDLQMLMGVLSDQERGRYIPVKKARILSFPEIA